MNFFHSQYSEMCAIWKLKKRIVKRKQLARLFLTSKLKRRWLVTWNCNLQLAFKLYIVKKEKKKQFNVLNEERGNTFGVKQWKMKLNRFLYWRNAVHINFTDYRFVTEQYNFFRSSFSLHTSNYNDRFLEISILIVDSYSFVKKIIFSRFG